MATTKGRTSTYRSDEQEIDLNLTLGGLYSTENPNEISVPQPFSQIIESVANNPAFQRAIEIIRSEMNNNSKDMPEINVMESTPYTPEQGNSIIVPPKITVKRKATSPTCEKGKSILLPESTGEKPSKKVKNYDELLDKGKSIELPESNGEKPLKKVNNSDEVLGKSKSIVLPESNGEKALKKVKNSDEVLDKDKSIVLPESNGEKALKKIKNSHDEVLDKRKSIVLTESNGEQALKKALKKIKNSDEVLDKGKSIVLPESKGEKALKKVKNSDEVLDKGKSIKVKNSDEVLDKGKSIVLPESNGEKSLKKVKNYDNIVTLMNASELLRTIPCMTTSGGIINGKLTEGIRYSDGQEKQISILCICHGRFFTAAEFVKHGGGKEADNPMKFIEVVDDA
ncbi:hypothetical protein R3W88_004462 [Solanum pinnatisectum]|uniref:Ninja-family protein n=1 Tax=Solanum pinnatisectum TaxID=50273 RepID=A0AAV9K9F1_9SOLN|nr:hypothetical protein R3W88_004462 [Solanum pinnatisectum]